MLWLKVEFFRSLSQPQYSCQISNWSSNSQVFCLHYTKFSSWRYPWTKVLLFDYYCFEFEDSWFGFVEWIWRLHDVHVKQAISCFLMEKIRSGKYDCFQKDCSTFSKTNLQFCWEFALSFWLFINKNQLLLLLEKKLWQICGSAQLPSSE